MAKKTKDEQQQVAAEVSSNESKKVGGEAAESKVEATEKKQPLYIETTEGKRLDKIDVYRQDGKAMVKAEYGTLSDGKTSKEVRKNMSPLLSRPLTDEQTKEYMRLAAEDPSKRSALEYAARVAYPMHVDDKKFHETKGVINGKEVDYIMLKKLTEKDVPADKKHLVGQWQLTAGKKHGGEGAHMTVMLDPKNSHQAAQILANIRHRAIVAIDPESKKVIGVGEPITLMQAAGTAIMAKEIRKLHQADLLEKAKSIDLSKYKIPEGIVITKANYKPVKDNPDRVWLNGEINSQKVSKMLTVNESTLVRNKLAPLDIMFVVNKELAKEVNSILAQQQSQEQSTGVHR